MASVRSVLAAPGSFAAWAAPGHRLPEPMASAPCRRRFPERDHLDRPGLATGYAHHAFAGWEQRFPRRGTFSATVIVQARGFNGLGTIDYNPVVPALGAGRRPADVNGVAGHVRLGAAVHRRSARRGTGR